MGATERKLASVRVVELMMGLFTEIENTEGRPRLRGMSRCGEFNF